MDDGCGGDDLLEFSSSLVQNSAGNNKSAGDELTPLTSLDHSCSPHS